MSQHVRHSGHLCFRVAQNNLSQELGSKLPLQHDSQPGGDNLQDNEINSKQHSEHWS